MAQRSVRPDAQVRAISRRSLTRVSTSAVFFCEREQADDSSTNWAKMTRRTARRNRLFIRGSGGWQQAERENLQIGGRSRNGTQIMCIRAQQRERPIGQPRIIVIDHGGRPLR